MLREEWRAWLVAITETKRGEVWPEPPERPLSAVEAGPITHDGVTQILAGMVLQLDDELEDKARKRRVFD